MALLVLCQTGCRSTASHTAHASCGDSKSVAKPAKQVSESLFAQSASQPLRNDAIITMSRSGLSEDSISDTILTSEGRYQLDQAGIQELQDAGISDRLIADMREANLNPPRQSATLTGDPASPEVRVYMHRELHPSFRHGPYWHPYYGRPGSMVFY